MRNIVFFLEEPSAEEMLKGILARILPENVHARFIVFEGKQDLEKQLERRLRNWRSPKTSFVVLRDQDSGDCIQIKRSLLEKCMAAQRPDTIVRIACRELESFYLGDLLSVEKGLKIKGLSKLQEKRKYRAPDKLQSPSAELLRLTKNRYQKVSGSRAIGKYLGLEQNYSHSFNVLKKTLRKLATSEEA